MLTGMSRYQRVISHLVLGFQLCKIFTMVSSHIKVKTFGLSLKLLKMLVDNVRCLLTDY